MSTCEPSTAAHMMLYGAGIGAFLSCLRRFDGNAGRFAANDGVDGVPPGILYFFWSQGWIASGLSFTHCFAREIISSGVSTTSCTSPASSAAFGLRC